jgi:hypothetical protein
VPPGESVGVNLKPGARKLTVVVHVVSSVSWLALMLCLLTLGATALVTSDPDTVRAAYRVMPILGDTLIIPLGLLSLSSGLVLSLGTRWRLFRYYWVAAKFWMTIAATAASIFALRARLHEAADIVRRHPTGPLHPGFVRYNLVIVPSVALCVYLTNVILSVVKPWGQRAPFRKRSLR